jgi:uncharacterized protein (UPF0261 family)
MGKTVCVIGTFDTKGEDHAFLRAEILKLGLPGHIALWSFGNLFMT